MIVYKEKATTKTYTIFNHILWGWEGEVIPVQTCRGPVAPGGSESHDFQIIGT